MTALTLLLASCAGSYDDKRALLNDPFDDDAEKMTPMLAELTFPARKPDAASDYMIGPEDLLDIDVFEVEDLKKSVRVSTSGYIKLPLIGKIMAKDVTVAELEREISARLEKYLEEPEVSVFVREYRSQQITVIGAVKKPQVYSVSGQKYLLDMLSIAGGLAEDAKMISYVQKFSEVDSPDEQKARTVVVDLEKLLREGQVALNIPLYSGDIVHVPKNDVFFVDGAVETPGSYQIKGDTTVTQALSIAGGFRYEAQRTDIRIYRNNGNPERDVLAVNYDAILDGEQSDISIKDKDIIIVPKNGVRNFFKGLATSLNMGIFSIGKGF